MATKLLSVRSSKIRGECFAREGRVVQAKAAYRAALAAVKREDTRNFFGCVFRTYEGLRRLAGTKPDGGEHPIEKIRRIGEMATLLESEEERRAVFDRLADRYRDNASLAGMVEWMRVPADDPLIARPKPVLENYR